MQSARKLGTTCWGTGGAGAGKSPQGCGTGGKTSILGIHGGWKLLYIFVCADLYRPSFHSVGVNVLSVMCARIEFM